MVTFRLVYPSTYKCQKGNIPLANVRSATIRPKSKRDQKHYKNNSKNKLFFIVSTKQDILYRDKYIWKSDKRFILVPLILKAFKNTYVTFFSLWFFQQIFDKMLTFVTNLQTSSILETTIHCWSCKFSTKIGVLKLT